MILLDSPHVHDRKIIEITEYSEVAQLIDNNITIFYFTWENINHRNKIQYKTIDPFFNINVSEIKHEILLDGKTVFLTINNIKKNEIIEEIINIMEKAWFKQNRSYNIWKYCEYYGKREDYYDFDYKTNEFIQLLKYQWPEGNEFWLIVWNNYRFVNNFIRNWESYNFIIKIINDNGKEVEISEELFSIIKI